MQRARDELLSSAGFAADEGGPHVRRQPSHGIEQLLHDGTATDQAVELELAGELTVRGEEALAATETVSDGVEQSPEPLEVEGLADVVKRAELDGVDGGIDRRMSGHQDHFTCRMNVADRSQHLEAADLRQPQVNDCPVGLETRQFFEDPGSVRATDYLEASSAREVLDNADHGRVVVYDQKNRCLIGTYHVCRFRVPRGRADLVSCCVSSSASVDDGLTWS